MTYDIPNTIQKKLITRTNNKINKNKINNANLTY